jgi:hypothetical protein
MENNDKPKKEQITESSPAENPPKKSQLKATIFGMLVAALIATIFGQFTKEYLHKNNGKMMPFVSPDKSFSATLPQGVKESRQRVKTPLGTIETFSYNAKSKYCDFAIAYCDYPDSFVAISGPAKILDGARDGAVHNVKGRLLGEAPVDLNGAPGREFNIETPQKMILKSRIYLAGRRLFQVMAIAKPDHAGDGKIAEVFDSFKINGE